MSEMDPSRDDPATQALAQPAFDLSSSVAHLLHRAHQLSGEHYAGLMGQSGLTQRQTAVLAALQAGAAKSQTELVQETGIDRSTLAEMVARMEAKGLVARAKADGDGRVKTVSLLPAGQLAFEQALPHLIATDAMLLARLPNSGGRDLIKLLIKMAQTNGSGAGEDAPKLKKKKDKKKKDRKRK
jgi:DNA-binding MarR family transcriptional regulator